MTEGRSGELGAITSGCSGRQNRRQVCHPSLVGSARRSVVIELGLGFSNGLRRVEEAGLAGGVDFESYRAWQGDRQANDRMVGRIDVAEHMGAHIALRSDTHCSFWLDGQSGLPRLVTSYLEVCAVLVGPT